MGDGGLCPALGAGGSGRTSCDGGATGSTKGVYRSALGLGLG